MDGNGVAHDVSRKEPNEVLIENYSNAEESEPNDQVFQNTVLQLSEAKPLTEQFQLIDQNGRTIHYDLQSLAGCNTQMMVVTGQSENGQVLHVIPATQPTMAQVIFPQGQILNISASHEPSDESESDGNLHTVAMAAISGNGNGYVLHSQTPLALACKTSPRLEDDLFPVPLEPLPPSAPAWARRLRSCEKIGDSYRGYCANEDELESVLKLHKQQTHSVWGTRQSPSSAKPATRMMWKSQYVPYDGIPFVNAGSRAIVMECQYGPRRKGAMPKKAAKQDGPSGQKYKATCPARIYIKKVQKFPEYRVPTDENIDRKVIRMEQEKAFDQLKKNLLEPEGVFRWYVQLPDEEAHQYHELELPCHPPSPCSFPIPSPEEEEETTALDENETLASRLHPQVADKIRDLVIQGIDEVYAVRKQLRKFVERELFPPDNVPERHNLSFFPTVNDIKNHIHQVQSALKNGELVYDCETIPAALQWQTDNENVLKETVTVTFAAPPSDGSTTDAVITKVESSQTGDTLSPETVQLLSSLSSLQPQIFAQLQGLQLQPTLSSADGTSLITVNHHVPHSPSTMLDPMLTTGGQSLVFRHAQNLQLGDSVTQNVTTATNLDNVLAAGQNVVMMGQLLTVGEVEDSSILEGEVHQVLFGDGQTIPIRIMDKPQTVVIQKPLSTRCTGQDGTESSQQLLTETL
ncbi:calcium-responsive transcription factor [Ambystoma mexicanum]|uniref:calcium-responsive transcription factor n=1 Tax=Ambystoma mexicanum TaxID=8296 RepID=UPI0037E8FD7F